MYIIGVQMDGTHNGKKVTSGTILGRPGIHAKDIKKEMIYSSPFSLSDFSLSSSGSLSLSGLDIERSSSSSLA
jgi:hypothetical protein